MRTNTPDRAPSIKFKDSRIQLLERQSKTKRVFRRTFSTDNDEHFKLRKSLADLAWDYLDEQDRKLFIQRICILTKKVVPAPAAGTGDQRSPSTQDQSTADYFDSLKYKLKTLIKTVNRQSYVADTISGVLLTIGDHNVLVIESNDDNIAMLLPQALEIIDKNGINQKVIFVQNNIKKQYFETFLCCRISPLVINEKFPPETKNDANLMGRQHWTIKSKLLGLCELIAENGEFLDNMVPQEELNKVIPEIQRLDLVMECSRYYVTVGEYLQMHGSIPMQPEEESLVWPTPFNYAPLGIFQRSPFDINLTFSNYGSTDRQKKDKDKTEADDEDDDEEE